MIYPDAIGRVDERRSGDHGCGATDQPAAGSTANRNAAGAAGGRGTAVRDQRRDTGLPSGGGAPTRQSLTLMLIGTVPRNDSSRNSAIAARVAHRRARPGPVTVISPATANAAAG